MPVHLINTLLQYVLLIIAAQYFLTGEYKLSKINRSWWPLTLGPLSVKNNIHIMLPYTNKF